MKFRHFLLIVFYLPVFCFAQQSKRNEIKVALRITPDSVLFCDYIIFEGNDVKVYYPSTAEELKKIFGKTLPFPVVECTPKPNVKFISLTEYLTKSNFNKSYEKLPINIDDFKIYANNAVIYLVETAIDKVDIKSDTLNIISKSYPRAKRMREERKRNKVFVNGKWYTLF